MQAPETDPDRGHSAAASNSVAPFSFLSPPFLAFSIIIKVVVSTFLYLFFFCLLLSRFAWLVYTARVPLPRCRQQAGSTPQLIIIHDCSPAYLILIHYLLDDSGLSDRGQHTTQAVGKLRRTCFRPNTTLACSWFCFKKWPSIVYIHGLASKRFDRREERERPFQASF